MRLELKTSSLREILEKCKANNIDVNTAKIVTDLYYDISKPDETFFKYFIKYKKIKK